MQWLTRSLMVLTLLGALAACTSLRVRSDYDASADLSACRSFGWLESTATTPAGAFDNPINNKRLRDAIAKRLVAKGLQPVAEGAMPDCLVGQAIGVRDSLTADGRSRFSFGIGTGWGWGHRGFGSASWDTGPYAYREGRISVDLYRAASKEPLWHAEAEVDVTQLTGADAEKRIDAVVTAIFARFPALTSGTPRPGATGQGT